MVIIQIVRDRIFNTSTGILFYLFIRENSFGKNFQFDKSMEFEVNIFSK